MPRENFYKVMLILFGLTIFPLFIYGGARLFTFSFGSIREFYGYFYASLLDLGWDGTVVWVMASAPYMIYEVYLMFRGYRCRDEMVSRKQQ